MNPCEVEASLVYTEEFQASLVYTEEFQASLVYAEEVQASLDYTEEFQASQCFFLNKQTENLKNYFLKTFQRDSGKWGRGESVHSEYSGGLHSH